MRPLFPLRLVWIAVLALTVPTWIAGSLLAADWPQWRGPNRDGKSAETGLLQ